MVDKVTPDLAPTSAINVLTFDQLLGEEQNIVELINKVPNGGHLFLTHPFRLLQDIGVRLAPDVEKEIMRRQPEISGLSDATYNTLKAAPQQRIRFRVHGLFQGDRKPTFQRSAKS
jgi:hypothetical protein